MTENQLTLEIVTPEKLLLSEVVDMVVIPGSEGDFGAQRDHAPFISDIRPGTLVVFNQGKIKDKFFISGGFSEIKDNKCTVLADNIVNLDALDISSYPSKLQDLKEDLQDSKDETEKNTIEKQIKILEAQIEAKEKDIYSV